MANVNSLEKKLGFNPFEKLNGPNCQKKGFITETYSPDGGRMYFTVKNAERIDYCRSKIDEWHRKKNTSDEENAYLLACLLDSVSSVSNTAGVYGAYLKKWDNRALKPFSMQKITCDTNPQANVISVSNSHAEDCIENIECDILYLDPPYTQNQYGTQYHLLETLTENDRPNVSKITGSRHVTPYRSKWSSDNLVHIAFEKIIAETKAKYIILSYSSDGFMTPNFIKEILCRYGNEATFVQKDIAYKNYTNKKSKHKCSHCEYLFFIEKKKEESIVVDAPLNYTGSKAKLIEKIRKYIPNEKNVSLFVDLFGGGFNFGANMPYKKMVYNDINDRIVNLLKSFYEKECASYIRDIKKCIEKKSLTKGNKDAYLKLRAEYNKNPSELLLYVLILYGFQQQIRFNGKKEFNNPAGNRWFNENLQARFIAFNRQIKKKNISFLSMDFEKVLEPLGKGDFIYADPPYSGTLGVYNDGKRGFYNWSPTEDKRLLSKLTDAGKRGVKFMLSYEDQGNTTILNWVKENGYRMISLDSNQGRYNKRKEMIVVNYEAQN